MSKARQFYVTLPSGSSSVDFPNNKPQSFKCRLKHTHKLPGKWEVALASITFPHTWFNIVEGRNKFVMYVDGYGFNLEVPPGYYKGPMVLIKAMNDAMNGAVSDITSGEKSDAAKTEVVIEIKYTRLTGKVVIMVLAHADHITGLKFRRPSLISSMLGFGEISEIIGPTLQYGVPGALPGTNVSDVNTIKKLFVYTDLVEYSAVGGDTVPLLRTVKVGGSHGDLIEKEFVDKYYIPLVVDEFDTIEIKMADNAGQPIAFQGGEVVIVLHFRPIPGALL
jgi:hypothetical protein